MAVVAKKEEIGPGQVRTVDLSEKCIATRSFNIIREGAMTQRNAVWLVVSAVAWTLLSVQSRALVAQALPIGAQSPATGGSTKTLKVGDAAPDFELPDQNGKMVRLSSFKGKRNVVLAFYVLAFTSG
ncbi:MAG: redoxin domain-containing protein [Acidobacteria bacterium]|nr:redoxin domain-containing protein [Acidobacteriota bacterium]